MKAKDLVGKLIISNTAAAGLNMPRGTKFKVVGYTSEFINGAIVDAGNLGWRSLKESDQISEKCETYWLVALSCINKVL